VLANEQAEGGKCWRCKSEVEERELDQWFLRITAYQDQLLDDMAQLAAWPERVLVQQKNWVGRSPGAEVDFAVEGSSQPIRVFTTRIDTIFGAPFMVLAPEHPLVEQLTSDAQRAEVDAYRARVASEDLVTRKKVDKEKTGVFTGGFCVNPATGREIPVWIADYVLMEYGTGAIMAVPGHDQRDFEFARKYDLPVRVVIQPEGSTLDGDTLETAYEGPGLTVNSGQYDGLEVEEAKSRMTAFAAARGIGGATVTYRLKDWLISRQRYWGTPIPVVYCEKDGVVGVPDEQLPVVLPKDAPFTGEGGNPLEKVAAFVNATCPKCGGAARRETDTMDTFVDSSWYFLRYCSPHDDDGPFDRASVDEWLPIHMYTGGSEHAVMHLMYFRFFTKALRDLGLLDFDEPTKKLRNQGQILGADHNRMSKSRGNVQNPDELSTRYGSDTVRAFLMFIGPWDQGGPWNPSGIDGVHRWLGRVWGAAQPDGTVRPPSDAEGQEVLRALRRLTHVTIDAVAADYEDFHFNTAISKLMELTNAIVRTREAGLAGSEAFAEAVDTLLLLMAPVAPHMAEELWSRRGRPYSIHQQPWPMADPEVAAADTIELPVQVDGKLRDRLVVTPDTPAEEIERMALASEHVQRYLAGRPPRRVIQIPGKLVNVVTPRD
jgi:leucyl-tRNA synthetase